MVAPDRLLAFLAVTVVFLIVPGPSVLFTVSRALTLGKRPALLTVVGNTTGVFMHVVAVALGVAAVVERSIVAFSVLKIGGAGYLVFLGVQAIRKRKSLPGLLNQAVAIARPRRVFVDGFVVGVSNPKSIVFFAAVLPQFAAPGANMPLQLMVLGTIALMIALVTDSVWALVAGTARDWFARSPRRLEAMGGTGGLVMIGLGAQLALTGRKD